VLLLTVSSAAARWVSQSVCSKLTVERRMFSNVLLEFSVCPSVCGWYAVLILS